MQWTSVFVLQHPFVLQLSSYKELPLSQCLQSTRVTSHSNLFSHTCPLLQPYTLTKSWRQDMTKGRPKFFNNFPNGKWRHRDLLTLHLWPWGTGSQDHPPHEGQKWSLHRDRGRYQEPEMNNGDRTNPATVWGTGSTQPQPSSTSEPFCNFITGTNKFPFLTYTGFEELLRHYFGVLPNTISK